MDALNAWDVALFAIAGYIAIVSLVRLMLARRNSLARQLQDDLERRRSESQRQAEEAAQDRASGQAGLAASLAKKKA
ncbi:MAG TPA: hypothetical protein VMF30_09395 [Pirellulales bacterium]|nr:hypothetical protein [Pirellulales bacterium]